MATFANEFPKDWLPGSDFIQIDDDEFALASEPGPGGLIAIEIDNGQGYLTLEAAKRLLAVLGEAIKNSEANCRPEMPQDFDAGGPPTTAAFARVADDEIPF